MTQQATQRYIYHIVHVDKLASIIGDGHLWSDAEARNRNAPGTVVGMQSIKDRRLNKVLTSHHGLRVGHCVPFYFCPRSIMLYLLHRGNHQGVTYRGGQEPIIHLVSEIHQAAAWADGEELRWAFTLSNASATYTEDRSDLGSLDEINWQAVKARIWNDPAIKEGKQAEFLVEDRFAWVQIIGIGVMTKQVGNQVTRILAGGAHRPTVKVKRDWYYI